MRQGGTGALSYELGENEMSLRIALLGVFLSTGVSVQAGVSEIFPPPPGLEPSHEGILETIYGGDFLPSGTDYNNGAGLSAMRFDDSLSPAPNGMISLLGSVKGDAADRVWTDAEITATAVWRDAIFTQQFGFDRGNGFEFLFDIEGTNENVTGSASVDLTGETWRWVRRDQDGSRAWSSDPGMNPDFLDHMVTYQVTGLNREGTTYLLFIEDLYGPHTSQGGYSDRDFDDVVIEIHATPEPTSIGLLAFGAVAVLRRRR